MVKNTLFILVILQIFSCSNPDKGDTSNSTIEDDKSSKNIVFNDQFIDGKPINHYLKSDETDKQVLDYYYGEFQIDENQATDSLLNTLINGSENTMPFYYKCFMNICKRAEPRLDRYLGTYCIELLETNTEYCINKLKQGYPDYFTGLVANEIYTKDNWEEEINNLSVRLHINLEDADPELRKELDLFIVGVKNDIEHIKRD